MSNNLLGGYHCNCQNMTQGTLHLVYYEAESVFGDIPCCKKMRVHLVVEVAAVLIR